MESRRHKTIRGLVIPIDWEEPDQVIRVAISTPGEDEIEVEDSGLGVELLDLTQEEVLVTGPIEAREDGGKRIRVTRYRVVDPYEDLPHGLRSSSVTRGR